MPLITRLAIKASLLWLCAAWLLESWRLLAQLSPNAPLYPPQLTIWHIFFVGWLTQLIFGVAYWLFPTKSRQDPRGRESLVFLAVACLNVGVALRVGTEIYPPAASLWQWRALHVGIALLHWLAALLFTVNIWARIKDKKRKKRNASA